MRCSWFNTETNKKKTSINNKNMHQIRRYLQISSCSIATLSQVCNYKVQFCAFKGDTQNLPLKRVGRGRSPPPPPPPPSSSQRLTGMLKTIIYGLWRCNLSSSGEGTLVTLIQADYWFIFRFCEHFICLNS